MKLFYLKITIFLLFLLSNSGFSQTTLSAGDIAIVGVNADVPKQFSFVLLVDIQAATKIYFTDSGVLSDGTFRANEGALLYIAPTDLSAGKLITYSDTAADFTAANDTNVGTNGFNLSTSGDQIIAFGGSTASPIFLFALQTNSNAFQAEATNSNTSTLPPGLTVGINAVAVGAGAGDGDEYDNSAYNLSLTEGNKSTLLAAIADQVKWVGNDSFITLSTADFTVTTESTPTPTTVIVRGNGQDITDGDTTPSTTDGTDYGNVIVNTTQSTVFSVENNTGSTVSITAASISGTNAANFLLNGATPAFPIDLATGSTENFTIDFSANTANTYNATVTIETSSNNISFDVLAMAIDPAAVNLIHAIQGSGTASPLVGNNVTIEGIVVGDFQDGLGTNGNLSGFFVQEEDSDADTDSNTSEGILIYDGRAPAINVAVGDKVKISGTVTEYYGVTEINALTSVSVISSGNTIPTAATLNMPVTTTTTNSSGNFIVNLEHVEGMLVNFPQTLTVSELFQLERFGELRLVQGTRPVQFTQENQPNAANYSAYLQDIAKRTIVLDDGTSFQNQNPIRYPDGNLDTSDALRMGDTVVNLTGVVNFSKGSGGSGDENYRILPTIDPVFNTVNTRTNTPPSVGGTLKITGLNVLNYFKTLDASGNKTANGSDPRGANDETEFNRQREKLITALKLMDADVFGLVEIENDFSPSSPSNAIQDIVNGLNASLGTTTYSWVDPGTQFVGDDAIAVGVIYKPSSVSIALGTTVETLDDSNLGGLGLPTSVAVFNGSGTNRVPLAVTFKEVGSNEVFTVVVNHLKSKGSAGASGTADNDSNDGAANSNQTRLNGVRALDSWLDTDPTASGDTDFILLGDFNAYAQEDPIKFLESEGYTDLANSYLGSDAYSYAFDGQIGTLDYAFASSSLFAQVTGTIEWHINADETAAIDYNLDFSRNSTIFDGTKPFRISDHDPVMVGLNLNQSSLGIQDLQEKDEIVKLYPIPVSNSGELNIQGSDFSGIVSISVYSITGAKLISKKINADGFLASSINVNPLASGTYFLVIESNGKRFSKSFVK
jgi:predicted extracellular nuclease